MLTSLVSARLSNRSLLVTRSCMSLRQRATAARAELESKGKGNFEKLDGVKAYLATTQELVEVNKLWSDEDARDLTNEILPVLAGKDNAKLWLTSIGPPERGAQFAELTGYPVDKLLADPENDVYTALGLKSGVKDAFFNPKTPLSLLKRLTSGNKTLGQALKTWKAWIPGKPGQATNQGGCFIFKGNECYYEWFDPATAVHVTPDMILPTIRELLG